MATITAYKSVSGALGSVLGEYRPCDWTSEEGSAERVLVFTPGNSYTLDIAAEAALGLVHPGMWAFSGATWARRQASRHNGHTLQIEFDDGTDLVEIMGGIRGECPEGNVTYRLRALYVVAEVFP